MPDGARIATFVYGRAGADGVPVLFLHGNGEEHGIFGPQIDAVTDAGRVAVALDSRAQGRSTRGSAHLTYELMAEDALACLDELGVGAFHVVGFSDGAIEALLLARDHPSRVRSLVAMGANLTPEGVDDTNFPMEEIAQVNEAWAAWLEAGSAGPDVDPALLSPTPPQARATAELMRLMEEEPHIPAASLGSIRCPAAIMAGAFDVIYPWETMSIANSVPHARLYVVAESGHSLPKQAPEVVSRVILRTVARA